MEKWIIDETLKMTVDFRTWKQSDLWGRPIKEWFNICRMKLKILLLFKEAAYAAVLDENECFWVKPSILVHHCKTTPNELSFHTERLIEKPITQ